MTMSTQQQINFLTRKAGRITDPDMKAALLRKAEQLKPRRTLRHVGYSLYDTWQEDGKFCVRKIGSVETARFDSESELEQHLIDLTVAFYEWIEAVFPGVLNADGEVIS